MITVNILLCNILLHLIIKMLNVVKLVNLTFFIPQFIVAPNVKLHKYCRVFFLSLSLSIMLKSVLCSPTMQNNKKSINE